MQFVNGAGYFDYEDVPPQFNYEETESDISINDDVLLEGESVGSGRHDHLSHTNGGPTQPSIQTTRDSKDDVPRVHKV